MIDVAFGFSPSEVSGHDNWDTARLSTISHLRASDCGSLPKELSETHAKVMGFATNVRMPSLDSSATFETWITEFSASQVMSDSWVNSYVDKMGPSTNLRNTIRLPFKLMKRVSSTSPRKFSQPSFHCVTISVIVSCPGSADQSSGELASVSESESESDPASISNLIASADGANEMNTVSRSHFRNCAAKSKSQRISCASRTC